ncbi:hypothetical protein Tco_0915643 [Tanacetum coccineum]
MGRCSTGDEGPDEVELLQKSLEELKQARSRDKDLFEKAKEDNNMQKKNSKSHLLKMKEEMVKEANAKMGEMFAQNTQPLTCCP